MKITINYEEYNLDREEYFNKFMDEQYVTIFPQGKRNAGGPMFL